MSAAAPAAAGVFLVRQDFYFLFFGIRGQTNRLQDPQLSSSSPKTKSDLFLAGLNILRQICHSNTSVFLGKHPPLQETNMNKYWILFYFTVLWFTHFETSLWVKNLKVLLGVDYKSDEELEIHIKSENEDEVAP